MPVAGWPGEGALYSSGDQRPFNSGCPLRPESRIAIRFALLPVVMFAGLREAGASRRVRILQGDGGRPGRVLPLSARAKIDAIVAGDLANELCASDGAAVAWLQRLRLAFPERWLLVSDYYGRLGYAREARRETLLHDYVQAISGQGIPPPDRKAWQTLYRAAGARLVHCIEDTSTTRFLHLLRL